MTGFDRQSRDGRKVLAVKEAADVIRAEFIFILMASLILMNNYAFLNITGNTFTLGIIWHKIINMCVVNHSLV